VRRIDAAMLRGYDVLRPDDLGQRCLCGFDVEGIAS
jgi:hypothetical protein